MQVAARDLRVAISQHMERHKAVYETTCLKPKHHWLFDVARQIEESPFIADGFVIERLHLRVKAVSEKLLNTRAFERSALCSLPTAQHNSLTAACERGGLVGATACWPGTEAPVGDGVAISGVSLSVGDVAIFGDRLGTVATCCRC